MATKARLLLLRSGELDERTSWLLSALGPKGHERQPSQEVRVTNLRANSRKRAIMTGRTGGDIRGEGQPTALGRWSPAIAR